MNNNIYHNVKAIKLAAAEIESQLCTNHYTETDMTNFGLYLLSEERKNRIAYNYNEEDNISLEERLSQVYHSDFKNWMETQYTRILTQYDNEIVHHNLETGEIYITDMEGNIKENGEPNESVGIDNIDPNKEYHCGYIFPPTDTDTDR